MIGATGAVRVMVATRPVDFRQGAGGLAALVREGELHGRTMVIKACLSGLGWVAEAVDGGG
ncbi:hypothetical protein CCR97_27215 [Rhodoplanes elegans]|uniref:Transposase n=1 Tax=Rhodoplanes elegans TaxID=29408 RepID=A0A327KTD2_9BRAD|nr:hypothetical protein [Rhodoplanes elegans]MBK5961870.1 hypothetical protein [Rhodoplanes elegans]RAI38648.1 hypothetical protein CH338_11955 [Rhodoplanes elegans]